MVYCFSKVAEYVAEIMTLRGLLFLLVLVVQPSTARAGSVENFFNTPGLLVEFEDYVAVLEGVCKSGNPEYCQSLASSLEKRKDSDSNRERIFALKKLAFEQNILKCESGELVPCQYVEIRYRLGHDINVVDLDKSRFYSEKFDRLADKMCVQGDGVGCFYVSRRYLDVGSKNHDRAKAHEYHDLSMKYFSEGCDKGNGLSCTLLAHRYKNGWTFGGFNSSDIGRALRLFDAACGLRHIDACIELSNLYSWGQYVKVDKLKVRHYSEKGCELESAIACSNILRSGAKLTKEEKAKIRDRVAILAKRNCANGRIEASSLFRFRAKGFR
jgi:TPR repeat protein